MLKLKYDAGSSPPPSLSSAKRLAPFRVREGFTNSREESGHLGPAVSPTQAALTALQSLAGAAALLAFSFLPVLLFCILLSQGLGPDGAFRSGASETNKQKPVTHWEEKENELIPLMMRRKAEGEGPASVSVQGRDPGLWELCFGV